MPTIEAATTPRTPGSAPAQRAALSFRSTHSGVSTMAASSPPTARDRTSRRPSEHSTTSTPLVACDAVYERETVRLRALGHASCEQIAVARARKREHHGRLCPSLPIARDHTSRRPSEHPTTSTPPVACEAVYECVTARLHAPATRAASRLTLPQPEGRKRERHGRIIRTHASRPYSLVHSHDRATRAHAPIFRCRTAAISAR